ncbi:MAG: hypothetical protein AAF927_07845 [Bacteroidota bacterium]
MNFLFWVFAFFMGTYLVSRLFGRQIVQFLLKRLSNRLLKNMQQNIVDFDQNYEQGNMRKNVFVDDEIKVTVPRDKAKPAVSADEIAEDVEFEEVH